MRQWKLEELHLDTLLSYRMLPDIEAFLDWKKQFETLCQEKKLASLADCLALINSYFRNVRALPPWLLLAIWIFLSASNLCRAI